MILKKIITYALVIFLWTPNYGQTKILITNNSLTINSKPITKNMSTTKLIQILGEPDRKHINRGEFWTYNNLGLVFIVNKKNVSFFEVNYQGVFEFDFTPEKKFKGTFLISGYNVVQNTTLQSLKSFPSLIITDEVKYYLNCDCDSKIGNYNLRFDYTEDCFKIKKITISIN